MLHVAPAAEPVARFGISVGKRAAKSSVERNRIRRKAREAFRRHALKRSPVDLVMTLTSRFTPALTDALVQEFCELMDRAQARLPS